MPKIKFTVSPKIPSDMVDDWGGYVKDSVHDVDDNEADRWVKRGVAEVISTRAANVLAKSETEAKVEAEAVKVEPIKAELPKVEPKAAEAASIIEVEEKDKAATPVGAQTTSAPVINVIPPVAPKK